MAIGDDHSGGSSDSGDDVYVDPDSLPDPIIFTADISRLFEDDDWTYDPDEDQDPSDYPTALNQGTSGLTSGINKASFEIASIFGAELVDVDYSAAVPQTRLIMDRPRFLVIAEPEIGLPPLLFDTFVNALPSNAIPANILAQEVFLHFVPLVDGAIPSNAIPANAIPSNLKIQNAIPANAIPSNYRRAIPSNYGLIFAIPSNITPQQLRILGANNVPAADAIPSNLTRSFLINEYGVPSRAIPSNAIPSNAIPSNAIPSNLVLSNAIPSNLVVLDLSRSMIDLPQFGVEIGYRPEPMIFNQRFKVMSCDGSCTSSGSIVVDSEAVDADYDLASIVSELSENPFLDVFRPEVDRVQVVCGDSCETVALPYRTGREQAPDVGVETVYIGPNVGIETVYIGSGVGYEVVSPGVCTEDLFSTYAWIGHKYTGDFAVQLYLAEGQRYQSEAYQLSIDSQLFADCVIDVENPTVLHCNREAIYPDRWVELSLTAQPSTCEVWGGTYYVCPAGETYHSANSDWPGGCCTTACWCDNPITPFVDNGCWNDCPGCPP
ncbi:MAG TPA: hypothetical protein G4O08_11575 [Anaerolineae bacterium]|nr:hypothetical protein [Anaerolineae bacterium]